jgi:hypothetical protein
MLGLLDQSVVLCKQGGRRFDPGHIHQTSGVEGPPLAVCDFKQQLPDILALE